MNASFVLSFVQAAIIPLYQIITTGIVMLPSAQNDRGLPLFTKRRLVYPALDLMKILQIFHISLSALSKLILADKIRGNKTTSIGLETRETIRKHSSIAINIICYLYFRINRDILHDFSVST